MTNFRSRKDGSHYPISKRKSVGSFQSSTVHLSNSFRVRGKTVRRRRDESNEDYLFRVQSRVDGNLVKNLNSDIKEESESGPDYRKKADQLDAAGFPIQADELRHIARQEDDHKKILTDVKKDISNVTKPKRIPYQFTYTGEVAKQYDEEWTPRPAKFNLETGKKCRTVGKKSKLAVIINGKNRGFENTVRQARLEAERILKEDHYGKGTQAMIVTYPINTLDPNIIGSVIVK